LKENDVAAVVQEALLNRYSDLYQLWAYVVMANHVHVFLCPRLIEQANAPPDADPQYVPLAKMTQSLKGFTALESNKLLNRTGQTFWQDESYDHWARDEEEFYRIIAYIENNPVKAGLVTDPADWPWSSAAERKRQSLTDICPLT